MKKIYASMFALAMGACITAGARTYQRANVNFDGLQMKTFEKIDNVILSDLKVSKKMNVKANAGEEWNNIGQGYFLDGIFGLGVLEVTYQENASTPGYYRIPDAYTSYEETALPFYVDATDPAYVRIPEQETGINVTINVDGQPFEGPLTILSYSAYADMMEISPADFAEAYPDLVITMQDGMITIPEDAILGYVGESDLFYANNFMELALPGTEYVAEWGDIMTGQMLDTFVEPMFNGYVAEEVNVPIQKNNRIEGKYRVIDPWFKLFGDEAADPTAGYYFTFDASDPTCVVVPYQSSGIRLQTDGVMYIFSAAYAFDSKEEFLASNLADRNITMDVETRTINFVGGAGQNGKIVGPIYFHFPNTTDPETDPEGFYIIYQSAPGYIKLPEFDGISSVAVDNNNAEAEYYNIQGVRVNNPVAGQLYIVKKGNEVSKRIMR